MARNSWTWWTAPARTVRVKGGGVDRAAHRPGVGGQLGQLVVAGGLAVTAAEVDRHRRRELDQ